jgi:cell division protein FtsB
MSASTSDEPQPGPVRRRLRQRLTGQEVRDRRRRLATWGLSLTLGVLLISSLVGDSGYLASLAADREAAALHAQALRLKLENQDLQQQARQLQDDPAAVEAAARRELGFIRPGETVIIIRDRAADALRPAR